MTPAEHYREAEHLIELCEQATTTEWVAENLAAAQTHATLALAGATFLANSAGMYPAVAGEFVDAITDSHPLSKSLAVANAEARAALKAAQR